MAYFMGIDIGSGRSKGVILEDSEIAVTFSLPSGIDYKKAARQLITELLKVAGISLKQVSCTVATGQGSSSVPYSKQSISDLRCCVKGIHSIFPDIRTAIDVEGQTTQVMRLGEGGQLADFVTNERCASGSGSFLEIISNVLQIPLEEIGPLSLKAKNPVTFTSACAVFGESEAVSRIAEGVPAEDILAGVHRAMADKITSMVERVGLEEPCTICGGGALNTGLMKTIESALGVRLRVPPQPDFVTALGAALFASELARDFRA